VGWLPRFFRRRVNADRYVLERARTEQYEDTAAGGWRWARYETFRDHEDAKGLLMRARHTKPLSRHESFANASRASLAFAGDFVELVVRGERLEHLDRVNHSDETRSGLSSGC
jgi:hypothetical protein